MEQNNKNPGSSGDLLQEGEKYFQAERLDEAEKIYTQILNLYNDKGNTAVGCFQLARIFEKKNMTEKAMEYYKRAISVYPGFYDAHLNLAILLRKNKKFDEALNFFMRAATIKPSAEAYANIAPILHNKGKFKEALASYQLALTLQPDHIHTMNNLGALYTQGGMYEEAENLYNKVLTIQPDDLVAINHLGIMYMSSGQLDKAISCYRRGLKIDPLNISMHMNILLAMVYSAAASPEELLKSARNFGESIADPLRRQRSFVNVKNPERKLRIGYVSPDFREHSVNYFLEPLLNHHDKIFFEIYGYSCSAIEDEVSRNLKQKFDHWNNISAKSDDEAADIIERDKIDILVDMAGHTGSSRLLVFARKPAPIQVTWLGYPATTGMKAMDYRITDIHAEPEGMTEHLNVETLWRLPEIFCCYQPHKNSPAVIDHPPFEDNGYVTFGCFNNFTKVTDPVLTAWAKILSKVPGSRLLLEILGIENKKYRDEIEDRLRRAGLSLDRVIFEPRKPSNQYVLYNKIDIALDPFPCNGGTTSMDTLWMGVPFVTLAGEHFVSRMGITILTNTGLPELIADTEDQYLEIAVNLANDKKRLKEIRHNLRDQFSKSPVMNQKNFVLNIEKAYREMWKIWCSNSL